MHESTDDFLKIAGVEACSLRFIGRREGELVIIVTNSELVKVSAKEVGALLFSEALEFYFMRGKS